ncbi:Morn repeat domain containing protein [Pandoravirus neocaledonia]|uniref:Morn repeat domain containing protein n=1 Tax=Pandoravirus neocaledonia TaxID=2107708 RepID=A0A2U7UC61_9VIRU|nr:Morn repeat domain containing protein [Pandoravirus neocaledonia]AVK76051.1 Morn repeat domain containing protein [Pandoravirus neocaledonia]
MEGQEDRARHNDDDDAFAMLPDELVLRLFLALGDDPRAVASWGATCRRYAAISCDPAVWRNMCAMRFPVALHERFADFGKDERWVYQARRCGPTRKETRPGGYVIRPYHHRKDTGYAGDVRQWRYYGDLCRGHAEGYGVGFAMAAIEKGTISTFADRPLLNDHGKYEGMWRHGPEGFGVHTYANGDRYVGHWHHGRRWGEGTMAWADGSAYRGMWVDDKRHGQGVHTDADGRTYDGRFKDDKRHGHGTFTIPGESTYTGQWRSDVRSGHGLYRDHSDNWTFDGQWRWDKRHGQGTHTVPGDYTYTGSWSGDKRNGRGVYKSECGWVYDGEWLADQRHGHGAYADSTGHRYIGEWRNDHRHGRGVSTWPDGIAHDGLWADGKCHGDGVRTIKGDAVTSTWINDAVGDIVVAVEASGLHYEGGWADGVGSCGQGVCTYPDGSIIHGVWRGVECLSCTVVVHPPQDKTDDCASCTCMACSVLAKSPHTVVSGPSKGGEINS